MAGGFAVTKEPGTDLFARRFHEAGFACPGLRLPPPRGERGAAAPGRAHRGAARRLAGRDRVRRGRCPESTRPGSRSGASPPPAVTCSASRRATRSSPRRSRRRRTPTVWPLRATRRGTRSRSRCCASPAWASSTPLGGLARPAAAAGAAAGSREPSRCSRRRTGGRAAGRSTRTTGTRTGGRRSPPARPCALASTGPAGTRPGCGARCWSWSVTRTSRCWPRPPSAPRRRAPRGELVRMPGGHYEPFLGGHERAVEAELSFLRRHCSVNRRPGRPGASVESAGRLA